MWEPVVLLANMSRLVRQDACMRAGETVWCLCSCMLAVANRVNTTQIQRLAHPPVQQVGCMHMLSDVCCLSRTTPHHPCIQIHGRRLVSHSV